MTKTEQSKASALGQCRLSIFSGERSFVRGLNWLAAHSADTQLSARQKWYLDALLWRYRKQLAGREEGFELPIAMPSEENYMKTPHGPRPQLDLL